MKAWLANKGLEHLRQYVQHGRHLKGVSTTELKERWIAVFRQWAANFRKDPAIRLDIEAELSIRGEEPPLDAVQPKFEALKRAAAEAGKQILANPEKANQVGSEILDEMEEFERASTREKH